MAGGKLAGVFRNALFGNVGVTIDNQRSLEIDCGGFTRANRAYIQHDGVGRRFQFQKIHVLLGDIRRIVGLHEKWRNHKKCLLGTFHHLQPLEGFLLGVGDEEVVLDRLETQQPIGQLNQVMTFDYRLFQLDEFHCFHNLFTIPEPTQHYLCQMEKSYKRAINLQQDNLSRQNIQGIHAPDGSFLPSSQDGFNLVREPASATLRVLTLKVRLRMMLPRIVPRMICSKYLYAFRFKSLALNADRLVVDESGRHTSIVKEIKPDAAVRRAPVNTNVNSELITTQPQDQCWSG